MPTLKHISLQEANEERYSRKHIDRYIRDEILADPDMQDKLAHGLELVQDFLNQTYYESKNRRLAQLQAMDIEALILNIFVTVAYVRVPTLLATVAAQLVGRIGLDDKPAAITTVAELLAVLCETDAFDVFKEHRNASLEVISNIPLSDQLLEYIENSEYLPPMVCEPRELTGNYTSGYLTHNDSLILGNENHHTGDICLDVLNLMNRVPLSLDTDFLSQVEEEPTFALDTPEKAEQWQRFKRQSYQFYTLMVQQGNRFYLTHKVDKRGRIYSQGYHINPQGASFKKAMIELADAEVVEGVPRG